MRRGRAIWKRATALFAMLYEELHRMAQRELRRGAAVTLSPTTLLHETFLNISHRESLAFGDCGSPCRTQRAPCAG